MYKVLYLFTMLCCTFIISVLYVCVTNIILTVNGLCIVIIVTSSEKVDHVGARIEIPFIG